MKISFQWGEYSDRITPKQKEKIEEGMRTEISNDLEKFKNPPDELLVHLFPDPLCLSLKGTATTTNGATFIKITCSLAHPGARSYDYLGCSYTDAQ